MRLNIEPLIIEGGMVTDVRGRLAFVNDFDMKLVRRFYFIYHSTTDIIRAWQGHRIEKKWFYCVDGVFEVKLVKVDDWVSPSENLPCLTFILDAQKSNVLYIPNGFANGFRALRKDSRLLVFSDKKLEESLNDDYRFNEKLWNQWG